MSQQFAVPQGAFTLTRYPGTTDASLRAWDAADEYVLEHLASSADSGARTLVINDTFGALAVALTAADHEVVSWSDSSLSHEATRRNLAENALDRGAVTCTPSVDEPDGAFGLVIVRIPRSLALLEDQLVRLRPHLTAATRLVGAAMTKQIHTSTSELFAAILGPTTTSLAQRKARLVHPVLDPALQPPTSPYPSEFTHDGLRVVNHANVFSREGLDQGTRELLANLPDLPEGADVLDLGCGNGLVGTVAARRDATAHVTFSDESYGAVASAQATFADAFPDLDATFVLGDGAEPVASGSQDAVLINPPFHAQGARGDDVAWRMFTGARRVLRPGGRIVVVGNRHLGYHTKLARLFGGSRTIGSSPKFVVLEAEKRARH